MRVVFTPHGYSPSIGGAQEYTTGLAEGLARLGHEVHVVSPDIADPEAFYELGHRVAGPAKEEITGVRVHRIGYRSILYRAGFTRTRGLALRSSLARYRRNLSKRVSALRPDIVITLPHLFPNVVETVALRARSDWSLVYAPLLHEHDPYWPAERVADAVAAADAVLALTEHEADRLVTSYRADRTRTAVIPPGVDIPEEYATDRPEPVVLALGRRAASKRLEVIYEAMCIVWNRHTDARLVVAGAPPEGSPDPAEPFRGDDRVMIIDRFEPDERRHLLTSARILASASLIESFGITTLEAWAHGTPVVVMDTPVGRSVVRDGIDGLLAGPDARLLAAQIQRAIADPALTERLGVAGRHRAETEFSWAESTRRLEGLLASLDPPSTQRVSE
jgi:glycosyltransferase involved in cell wall biosynthesis